MLQIIPVTNKKESRLFLEVPVFLYTNDPNWIRPLDKDINEVFDPKKNKAFRHGKVIRWVLIADGKPAGRIAAFTNSRYKSKGDDFAVGGIGFFECINDQAAADLLFDNARHWLLNEGIEAMDGPINFGERDRWWGLVTEGFLPPLYCMNYNLPYYKELFENYGFKLFYNQVCLGFDPKAELPEKILSRHRTLSAGQPFRYEILDKRQLRKYAADFTTVYNKAWAGHGGLKQVSESQIFNMFSKMKPVMDPNVIGFVYHQNDPVGIFVNLPDLNQWFKYLGGKFTLLHKLYFLYVKKFKPNPKFVGLVFGIVPEWHGKGADAYMIAEASKIIRSPAVPYTQYEMQWIGDFNPKMINIAEGLGDVFKTRNLVTYRYLFDRTKEFRRHPLLV